MAELDELERAYGELARAGHLDKQDLEEIGQLAVGIVVTRTKRGRDADGKAFAAYKPGYAEERQRAHLPSTPVDLARSGHMLGAMTPAVTGDNEVTVGFASELEATKAASLAAGVHKTVAVRGARSRRESKPYERRVDMDARDFLDVRRGDEMELLGEAISEKIAAKVGG